MRVEGETYAPVSVKMRHSVFLTILVYDSCFHDMSPQVRVLRGEHDGGQAIVIGKTLTAVLSYCRYDCVPRTASDGVVTNP